MRQTRICGPAAAAGVLALGTLMLVSPTAEGIPPYENAFERYYGNLDMGVRMDIATGASCNICHDPSSEIGNCYRADLIIRLGMDEAIEEAIDSINMVDSDGDGVPNGEEILAQRPDGSLGYNPGLVGPIGADPCGDDPIAAVSGMPETPPSMGCATDVDDIPGVDVLDLLQYLAAWFVLDDTAELTGDVPAQVDVLDLLAFLQAWFAESQDPACEG